MKTIERLLGLASEFAKYGGPRRSVDFGNQGDREFYNEVMVALKEAYPALRSLVPASALPAPAHPNPEVRVTTAPEQSERPISDLASDMEYYAGASGQVTTGGLVKPTPTIQSADPGTPDQSPSNGASPGPETAHSTHNPTEPPKTDGTAAESGRKSGTGRKISPALAKLNAARKAAALARKKQSAGKSEKTPTGTKTSALPAQPPTTA